MAVELSRDRPWADAICPICTKYFTDPVSLECGHDFCRSCITRCWEELCKDIICPRGCKSFVEGRKFEPNRELALFVEATKQVVEQVKEEAKGWVNCEKHWKPLNLFCEDDQAAICERCKTLEAHRNHRVVGKDFTKQIMAYMKNTDDMRNEITIYSWNCVKATQKWLMRIEAERKRTIAKFKHLRQFLDEQERLRLARLVQLEKDIMKKQEGYEGKVRDQITFLDDVYSRMEETYYDDTREFLQDFGSALRSYMGQLEIPVPLLDDVKEKILKFCDRKLFLEDIRKEFTDEIAALLKGRRRKRTRTEVAMEERGTRVDVTLDPDTANQHLILSADKKRMSYSDLYPGFSLRNPERFNYIPFVMGRQGFTSGRHWWEVRVEGNGCGWAVGVAKESLERDATVDDWDFESIWVVGKRSSNPFSPRKLLAFLFPEDSLLILAHKPEKIRVCLDYAGGQVAFFNAETDESIFVFHSCSFLGEKVRPFFWLWGKSVTLSC